MEVIKSYESPSTTNYLNIFEHNSNYIGFSKFWISEIFTAEGKTSDEVEINLLEQIIKYQKESGLIGYAEQYQEKYQTLKDKIEGGNK